MTGHYWWQITADVSLRNLVVQEQDQDTRSHIVDHSTACDCGGVLPYFTGIEDSLKHGLSAALADEPRQRVEVLEVRCSL